MKLFVKGIYKNEFEQSLATYLNESIPKNVDLYSLLNISTISEQKKWPRRDLGFDGFN